MQHLRLTHPRLDFWIDLRLRNLDGRWPAVADLADQPDVGPGRDLTEALREALMALGPRLASEPAANAPFAVGGGISWERLDNRRASRLAEYHAVPSSPPLDENPARVLGGRGHGALERRAAADRRRFGARRDADR